MDPVISYKVDKDIFTNKKEYFFTTLNNRFELMNKKLKELLEKRYQKEFEPLYILPAKPNTYHRPSNYVVLNQQLKTLRRRSREKRMISLPPSSVLNAELSESAYVNKLIRDLSRKQNRIFFIGFTSAGLNLDNERIINIGPQKEVAEKYDNKIDQIKLFKKLNLPRVRTNIHRNGKSLMKTNTYHPIFVSPSYTTGGTENMVISSKEDWETFFNKLRPINKNGKFFAAEYIEDVSLSPNSVGIICGRNDSRVLCLTDQFVRGTEHLGNIYPSSASKENKEKMFDITRKIGDHLSRKGFRGMYGCDFIIDSKNRLYVVDLNPRRQSCYLTLQLMAKSINLLEMELKLALGEEIPDFDHRDIGCRYTWLQKKLKPRQKYQKIKKELNINEENTPFTKVGEKFVSTYFPKNYILSNKDIFGYYILSGEDRYALLERSQQETENILLNSLQNASKQ